jgi:hypothetical protein
MGIYVIDHGDSESERIFEKFEVVFEIWLNYLHIFPTKNKK